MLGSTGIPRLKSRVCVLVCLTTALGSLPSAAAAQTGVGPAARLRVGSAPTVVAILPGRELTPGGLRVPPLVWDAGAFSQDRTQRDFWGAREGYGRAWLWWSMSYFVVWAWNEQDRGKIPITQTSPRTWWDNITSGFEWDDNEFEGNQFWHPYSGALYYNSFRNHGFPFWGGGLRFWRSSAFYTLLGSLLWECCGEGHRMSPNDLVATTMGGWMFGEMGYRTSSWILDFPDRRFTRVLREVGGLAFNPPRALDRFAVWVDGSVESANQKPSDADPLSSDLIVSVGGRAGGNWSSRYVADVSWRWGSPFALPDSTNAYDLFSVRAELYPWSEQPMIGRVQLQGDLYDWDVTGGRSPTSPQEDSRDSEPTVHRLKVVQNFDYFNNPSFTYGAQSLGLALFSSFQWMGLVWRSQVDGSAAVLAAIGSEFANKTPLKGFVERPEGREYDYALGPGARAKLEIAWPSQPHRRILEVDYQYAHLFTQNGSDFEDYDSSHRIHVVGARARLLARQIGQWVALGLDVDYLGQWHRSQFSHPDFRGPLTSDTQQIRLMLTFEERKTPPPNYGERYLPPTI